MDSKEAKKKDDEFHYNREINLRSILHNAIRMQALYSGKRIKIVEASKLTN
jgi:hypothetical protein